MHKVYDLKEMLCEELEKYGDKAQLSAGELDVVDKLAHSIKNLDKIIENYEEEGYSERYDFADDGNRRYSMARGNGRRRDSRGRYSRERDGRYSMDNDMLVSELKELMHDAPNEQAKQEFRKFISKMEQM